MPIPFIAYGLAGALGVVGGFIVNDRLDSDNVPVVNVGPQPRPIPPPFTLGLYGVVAIGVLYAANRSGVLNL